MKDIQKWETILSNKMRKCCLFGRIFSYHFKSYGLLGYIVLKGIFLESFFVLITFCFLFVGLPRWKLHSTLPGFCLFHEYWKSIEKFGWFYWKGSCRESFTWNRLLSSTLKVKKPSLLVSNCCTFTQIPPNIEVSFWKNHLQAAADGNSTSK